MQAPVVYRSQAMQQQQQQQQQVLVNDVRINCNGLYWPGYSPSTGGGFTALIFGPIGSLKTTWCAQAPNAIIASSGQEQGERVVGYLPELYGLPVCPVVPIHSTRQYTELVHQVAGQYQSSNIFTFVTDSLTYIMRLWQYELLEAKYGQQLAKRTKKDETLDVFMDQRDWGLLSNWLQHIMVTLHKTKMNILWTALAKEQRTKGGEIVGTKPMISGESCGILAGQCQMVIYSERLVEPNPKDPMHFQVHPVFHTSPSNMTRDWVRHKYANTFPEGRLVDPQYGDWPTFRAVASRIPEAIYGLRR